VAGVKRPRLPDAHKRAAAAQHRIQGANKQVVPRLDNGPDVGQEQLALEELPVILALVVGDEYQPFSRIGFPLYFVQADHAYVAETTLEQEVLANIGNSSEGLSIPVVMEETQ
jgi:hypothetical protein